jgi:hypothetical protein
VALAAAGAVAVSPVLVVTTAAHASSSTCAVAYRKTWDTGTAFGADLTITNTGGPVDGWSLGFAFGGNQRITNGWPVAWTQPAGSSQVTAASTAPWNARLATGKSISIGFRARYRGANTVRPCSISTASPAPQEGPEASSRSPIRTWAPAGT